ncbi:hypothetical protein PsYK624_149800 [Phanerochaete sordida]|uniref:Uncharacterized protein n=1 Tax=Phanerochaete sordida TaxID=48140 RepID=A0A9P3GQZ6_9APHY|nr:hypothetical protein PsYK624_149800 [Phanerochaete sordida]
MPKRHWSALSCDGDLKVNTLTLQQEPLCDQVYPRVESTPVRHLRNARVAENVPKSAHVGGHGATVINSCACRPSPNASNLALRALARIWTREQATAHRAQRRSAGCSDIVRDSES